MPSGAVAVQWTPVTRRSLSGQVLQGPPRWSQSPSTRRPPRYSATPSSAVCLETASPGRPHRVLFAHHTHPDNKPPPPLSSISRYTQLLFPGLDSLRLLPPQFILLVPRTVRSLHTPISLIRKRRHSGVHINRKLSIIFQLQPETVRISLGSYSTK